MFKKVANVPVFLLSLTKSTIILEFHSKMVRRVIPSMQIRDIESHVVLVLLCSLPKSVIEMRSNVI